MAANGEHEYDGRDRNSTYYAETIAIPRQEVKAKTASQSKKNTSTKDASSRKSSGGAFAAPTNDTVRRNRKIAIISVSTVAAVLVLCLCIGLWFYFTATADTGLIMDNTYVAGINIGGMTPQDAVTTLERRLEKLYSQSIVLTLPDRQLELTAADTKVHVDVNLLVNDAYRHGRTGSRNDRIEAMANAAQSKREISLLSYLTIDNSFINAAIDQFLADSGSTLTQPSIQIEGTRPTAPKPEDEENADKVYQKLTIVLGTSGIGFDTDAVYDQILDAYDHLDFEPIVLEYHTMEPDSVEMSELIEKYCTAPVDAKINENDYTIVDEVWGYGFNAKAAENLLKAAGPGESITLTLTYIQPEITREKLEDTLFKDELASCDTIYYLDPPRTNNLVLACKAINNLILRPGETFSFNEVLGERTAEKGYQKAGAYADGEIVEQLGGGICQVASTLYYCTLYADLEVLEREEHMFTADYLPLGMDATVNWDTIDFRFRNNTDYPIRIEAVAEDSYVSIVLRGTDDKGYYVEMDYKILKEYQWETVERVLEEDNKDGYVDGEVIYNGWMGYSVDTYKYKYDKKTDEFISKELESHSEYSKRDKTVCKINKPTEDTTAAENTDETEATEAPANSESDGESPEE